MPSSLPPKSMRLAAPLKEFKIPIVSWSPNSKQFKEFQKDRFTYSVPVQIEIKGRELLRVASYDVDKSLLGEFILPVKYYTLWRRLVYGALLQEKMFKAWIKRTKRLRRKSLNAVEEEEINLKKMAGVRLVQYLLCRRLVLEELMQLRFDSNREPVVHSLIEFGIRESRDWLSETFENAKKQGGRYLYLDPTIPKNKKEFEKGYHAGLEYLSPPEDDNWWKGDFSHFNFESLFEEIAESVPKTIADKSFEESKWIIDSSSKDEPDGWNESKLDFFSAFFINFLVEKGVDPRNAPEAYFRSYIDQMDLSDGMDGLKGELGAVFGHRYDEERLNELADSYEQHGVDEFIRELGLPAPGETDHEQVSDHKGAPTQKVQGHNDEEGEPKTSSAVGVGDNSALSIYVNQNSMLLS